MIDFFDKRAPISGGRNQTLQAHTKADHD